MPLTLYNKYKGMCEPLLCKHTDDELHRRDHPPGDGVRLRPAPAPRSVGQHPDQSRRQQRQDHRVRRRADAAQPAHRGLLRRRAAAARRAGREDRTARSSTSAIRTCRSWTSPSWSSAWSRRNSRRRARSGSSPRRATTSAPITSIPTRFSRVLGLRAQAHDRGRGARSLPRLHATACCPNSMDDDSVLQRPHA